MTTPRNRLSNAQFLEEAIRLGKAVSFYTRRADGRHSPRRFVYPRRILERNGHLFVQTWSPSFQGFRMFHLDRVYGLQWAESSWPPTSSLGKGILIGAMLLACAAGWIFWTFSGGHPEEGPVLVTSIVDGDTIYVGRGWRRRKIRLIGVDTPETVDPRKPVQCYGVEAKYFTQIRLQGQHVNLRFKPDEKTDAYGRLLAYVYLEDGSFLNLELIKYGFARAYTRFPFKYRREFTQAEREARRAHRGLWKACAATEAADGRMDRRPVGTVSSGDERPIRTFVITSNPPCTHDWDEVKPYDLFNLQPRSYSCLHVRNRMEERRDGPPGRIGGLVGLYRHRHRQSDHPLP